MNERGFVFPLTLSVLLLFSIFFMAQLNQLTLERKFFHEIETFEKNHLLLLKTLKIIEQRIGDGDLAGGEVYFPEAAAAYTIEELDESLLEIEIMLTAEGERLAVAWATYDLQSMTTVKWLERN